MCDNVEQVRIMNGRLKLQFLKLCVGIKRRSKENEDFKNAKELHFSRPLSFFGAPFSSDFNRKALIHAQNYGHSLFSLFLKKSTHQAVMIRRKLFVWLWALACTITYVWWRLMPLNCAIHRAVSVYIIKSGNGLKWVIWKIVNVRCKLDNGYNHIKLELLGFITHKKRLYQLLFHNWICWAIIRNSEDLDDKLRLPHQRE